MSRSRRAVNPLLLEGVAAGRSIPEAARSAGIGRSAAYRAVGKPEFQSALARLQTDVIAAVREELRYELCELGKLANERLRQLLDSANEAIALGACKHIHNCLSLGAPSMAVTADPPNASLSKDDVAGLVRLLQAEGQLDDKPQALAAYQRLTVLWERGDAPSGSGSTLEELKLIKTVVQEVWPASEAPASSLSNMGETAH